MTKSEEKSNRKRFRKRDLSEIGFIKSRVLPLSKSAIFSLLVTACAAQTNQVSPGTIQGAVGLFEGNCMPSPGVPPCEPSPITTTVFITEPSEIFDIRKLKDSVITNDKGFYKLALPAGSYSLFLRDGIDIVCAGLQCDGVCTCTPFQITSDSTTHLNANLDHASW